MAEKSLAPDTLSLSHASSGSRSGQRKRARTSPLDDESGAEVRAHAQTQSIQDQTIAMLEDQVKVLQSNAFQEQERRTKLEKENRSLKESTIKLANRASRLSREFDNYKKQQEDLESCSITASAQAKTSPERVISQNEQEISLLLSQLYECQRLKLPLPHAKADNIRTDLESIEYDIKCLCLRASNKTSLDSVEAYHGLVQDIRKSLQPGSVSTSILRESELSLLETRVSQGTILRCLISTAVRRWIFEADIFNFDYLESELLAMYREKLLAVGGPSFVHSLDFTVHADLFKSSLFQNDTLPMKKEDLTHTLSQTLSLTDSKEKDYLGRIIEKALKLKIDMMLSPARYRFQSFQPGTAFDQRTMRLDTVLDNPARSNIACCVFPALYFYASKDPPELYSKDCPISGLTVQSSVLEEDRVGDLYDNGRLPLSKAVVLME